MTLFFDSSLYYSKGTHFSISKNEEMLYRHVKYVASLEQNLDKRLL